MARKVHHQSTTGLGHETLRQDDIWDLAAQEFSPYLIPSGHPRIPGKHRGREQAALCVWLSSFEHKWLLEMIKLHLILLLIDGFVGITVL